MKRYACLLTLLAVSSAASQEIPPLKGHVNDHAGILSADDVAKLESKLEAHEKASSDQIVILIVKSFDGINRAQYAHAVFEKWKIGTKDQDNGVLILQSTGDRQIQIATGRGAEAVLPDGKCGTIRDKMTPYLKKGEFFKAYDVATDEIIAAMTGEFQPLEQQDGRGIKAFLAIAFVVLVLTGSVLAVMVIEDRKKKIKKESKPRPRTPLIPHRSVREEPISHSPIVPIAAASILASKPSPPSPPSYTTRKSSDDDNSSWFSSSSDSGSSGWSSSSDYSGGGGSSDGGGAGGDY